MKILLVQPSHLDENGEVYKIKKALIPNLTMPYIAALTPLTEGKNMWHFLK